MANRHRQRRIRITAVTLTGVVAGMVGLSFAAVPLYQLFCQVTGYGGTPQVAAAQAPGGEDGRIITVRFDANVNGKLPWRFHPEQREITVTLGEEALATYAAANVSDRPVVGTATFNVTPHKAGPYFNKIECFCFTRQQLNPGERVSMPVAFYVDPEIWDDPDTRDVKTITLSYTFFRDPDQSPVPGDAETVERGAADRDDRDG